MVHFKLLLFLSLCVATLADPPRHNPYQVRERERERERENRPWRLESVRAIPYGREGPERETLLERERLGKNRLDLDRNIQRERIERERLGLERSSYGPIGGLERQRDRHNGYGHGSGLNEGYGYGLGHGPSYSLVPWVEPTKGVLSNGHSGNIELQNKIVREVYSPTYIQPEYIVDYRFLRSGGRAFTRGLGGQIIILPRGVKEIDQNGHNSYDRLIEELQIEEEHRGKVPYRRVVIEGDGRGYRRDGLEDRRGELGERREELGYRREGLGERRGDYGQEGFGERREYGYGRIPREDKAGTMAAEPKVETVKVEPKMP